MRDYGPEYIRIGGAIYKKSTRNQPPPAKAEVSTSEKDEAFAPDLDQTQTPLESLSLENDTVLLGEFIALRDGTMMSMKEILREFGVTTEQLTPDVQRYVRVQIVNDEITQMLTGYPAEQSSSNPRSTRPEVRPEPEPQSQPPLAKAGGFRVGEQSDMARRARNIMFLPTEDDK